MNTRLTIYLGSLIFLFSTLLSVVGLSSTAYAVVDNTPDCDTVAIIRCGTMTTSEVRSEYDKNDYGDLPTVFNAFGISRADLNGSFVDGVVWRDGRVTVGDTVVATGAITAGRNYGGTPIPGTNGAAKFSTSKFVTEGQTAHVRMVNGMFDFAVIKSCGNPVNATPKTQPPAPTYECVALRAQEITRTKRQFNAEAKVTGDATIVKYDFSFGDGGTATSTTSSYTYDYKKPGTYTARVTVHVKVGAETKQVTSPSCQVPVTIKEEQIKVCELATKQIITINPSQFDASKHSKDLNACAATPPPATVQVCDLTTKTIVTIKESEFDAAKHSKDLNACREVPQVLASTGPADIALGGLGLSSLTAAGYYWRASRSRLIAKLLNR